MMPALQQKPRFKLPDTPQDRISAVDSARYTLDLLENLRKMARLQGQTILAHLLELAQAEARMAVRPRETGKPDGPAAG